MNKKKIFDENKHRPVEIEFVFDKVINIVPIVGVETGFVVVVVVVIVVVIVVVVFATKDKVRWSHEDKT